MNEAFHIALVFLAACLAVNALFVAQLVRRADAQEALNEAREDDDIAEELLQIEREMSGHGSYGRNLSAREIV